MPQEGSELGTNSDLGNNSSTAWGAFTSALPQAVLEQANAARAVGAQVLANQYGEEVSLFALGEPAVVVFYPFAFSQVCTGELQELASARDEFERWGVRLLAVSVDHKYALRAYAQELFGRVGRAGESVTGDEGSSGSGFDLLADFWPHGAVARAWGAFDEVRGMALRHTYGLSASGEVIAGFSSETGRPRSWSAYQELVRTLQTGWRSGP